MYVVCCYMRLKVNIIILIKYLFLEKFFFLLIKLFNNMNIRFVNFVYFYLVKVKVLKFL